METSDGNTVNLHTDVLPVATRRALVFLSKESWLNNTPWYLAGGTALALHYGHRKSVDLDFFTSEKDFSLEQFLGNFTGNEKWETTIARTGTIYGVLDGAKISFIAYPFFTPKEPVLDYGFVRILSPRDIAVMKIIAISQRGKKRDFFDLYWYVKHQEPLKDILRRVPDQYATVTHDFYHILKSLTYFDDAEEDSESSIHFDATWASVKKYFQQEIPRLTKELLLLQN